MDGGACKAAVHRVAEGQTRLSDFTFTFHFHALEKKMATHSSVLAWRIPGMAEPGGLLSMGSQSRTRLKRLSSSSRSLKQCKWAVLPEFSVLSRLVVSSVTCSQEIRISRTEEMAFEVSMCCSPCSPLTASDSVNHALCGVSFCDLPASAKCR